MVFIVGWSDKEVISDMGLSNGGPYFEVVLKRGFTVQVLHENIDRTLLNKLHGPMHCRIGVTCVYNEDILCCYNAII